MQQLIYFVEDLFMLVLFVGIGLIFGIIGWRTNQYAKMYGGFGHFTGAIISFSLSYLVSLEDSSKGIAIMILYPLLAGIGWLLGLLVGKRKDRRKKE
ncbi:hypothetical protein J1P26_10990 [Neobacillus sp. MM2021_6]|uniref:hypothetical protein n=1 Tax=Bacillaceae TaxID=186817 RepID=UPI0014078593|nr:MULTISPECIES: hypothetical protein [Bacillaceae]MBO0960250.1 hypothetical protein [Neobacillus sp. MM2021_6]NHC19380.1 hypothetical protein [Bacillus sp. MM2020_4]